jgi:hypothetical protein
LFKGFFMLLLNQNHPTYISGVMNQTPNRLTFNTTPSIAVKITLST